MLVEIVTDVKRPIFIGHSVIDLERIKATDRSRRHEETIGTQAHISRSGRPFATLQAAPARPTYAAPLVRAKRVLIVSSPAILAVSPFGTRTRNLQPQTLAKPCRLSRTLPR